MKKVYRYLFADENEYQSATQWIKEKNIITLQDGIHFGNCCLVRIPQDMVETIKTNFRGQVDMEIPVLEKQDIELFSVGDKVNIVYFWGDGAFMPMRNQLGTVYSISDGKTEITIKKKGSKKYGYCLRVGDDAQLVIA
jgi:hypothetical protein